jgi:hypothetical protein
MFAEQKPSTSYARCNEALLRAVPVRARLVLEVGCGEGQQGTRLKQQVVGAGGH